MLTQEIKDGLVNDSSLTHLTDEELFRNFRDSGDRSIFAVLLRRYEREVFGYLRRYLGDAELAEDTFQATFLTVYRKADQFEDGRSFRPWLYAVATNKAIDAQRAKKRQRVKSLDAENANSLQSRGTSMAEQLVDPSTDVQTMVERSETGEEVRNALEELNEISKQVIQLVYFQGMKYSEAAETLEIPVGTVRSRLHVAIRKLQEVWQRRSSKKS